MLPAHMEQLSLWIGFLIPYHDERLWERQIAFFVYRKVYFIFSTLSDTSINLAGFVSPVLMPKPPTQHHGYHVNCLQLFTRTNLIQD
jgi:hypothetical protein